MNDDAGTTWATDSPSNSAKVSSVGQEIRGLRSGVGVRLKKEHTAPADSSVGGEHLAGSARVYTGATAPTKKPDGTTSFDTNDEGRVWWNSTSKFLQVRNSSLAFDTVRAGPSWALLRQTGTPLENSGTFTAGNWLERHLDTEAFDSDSIVALDDSTGRFTLQAGTYRIRARASAYKVNGHVCKIRSITSATDIAVGMSAFSGSTSNDSTVATVSCEVVLGGANTLALLHQCQTSRTDDGQGQTHGISGVDECYAEVEIERVK